MTKVKICGLSTPEAVATAVEAGADYIGFVFTKSKRQVSLEQAHQLAKGVTAQTKVVGVFVSPSLEELEEAIGQVPLDIVQIHGSFDEVLITKDFSTSYSSYSVFQIAILKSRARRIIFSLMLPLLVVARPLTGNSWLISRLSRIISSLVA